jgi:hypothetical protein
MGLKRKQKQLRQEAYFEQKLQNRLSFLSGKGIESPKADKDSLVKKLQANIRAIKNRLKLIADNEKRTEEIAKVKAERAAAPLKEQEGGKVEKPKKAAEEGKGKKIKTEKKAAPPKAQESGKSQKPTEPPEEAEATKIKNEKEAMGEPAGQVKADK